MLDQPKAIAWTIVDADGFEQQKNSKGPENEAALKAGTLYYADSIEDLAKKIGVPANNLKEAVDTYNKAVETKKDPLVEPKASWSTRSSRLRSMPVASR